MSVPRFEIIGLDELIKDLEVFGKEAKKEMRPVVNEAGDVLLAKTKGKVPVKSGALRDSLFLKRPNYRRMYVANTLTWGDDVRAYAAPLELGHNLVRFGKPTLTHVEARPFLRPAADESKEKVARMIVLGMDNALEKLLGGKL